METLLSRTQPRKAKTWPQQVHFGRVNVSVYRRPTPGGAVAFMVANYAEGKRRFDCYASPEEALREAKSLAERLSKRDVLAASMTRGQAVDYASATQALAPFSVSLSATAAAVAECLKLVGDLPTLQAAAKFYAARNK